MSVCMTSIENKLSKCLSVSLYLNLDYMGYCHIRGFQAHQVERLYNCPRVHCLNVSKFCFNIEDNLYTFQMNEKMKIVASTKLPKFSVTRWLDKFLTFGHLQE